MADASDTGNTHPLFRQYKERQRLDELRKQKRQMRQVLHERIISHTAPPWPDQAEAESADAEQPKDPVVLDAELLERESYLRRGRAILEGQQRSLREQEMLLNMREKYLQEKAELISARERALIERLKASVRHAETTGEVEEGSGFISEQEQENFNNLREELERREKSLNERDRMMREREQFIEESETTLFEKAQELQEREEELASLRDELEQRKRKLDERDGIVIEKEKL